MGSFTNMGNGAGVTGFPETAAETMETVAMDQLLGRIDAKVAAIFRALDRYAPQMTEAQFDHLAARYVLGLSASFCADGGVDAHIAFFRRLIAPVLPGPRVERVLVEAPSAPEEWIDKAFDALEQLGYRDGDLLQELVEGDRGPRKIMSGLRSGSAAENEPGS